MYPKTLRGAAALALLLGLSACKDGTGSPPEAAGSHVEVKITATVGEPAWVTEGGEELIQCSVDLVATATGRQNATAVWDRAVFRWHMGADQAVVDSVVLAASEVIESWGGNTITAGQSLTSGWWFRAGAPFSISADYHYGADGTRIGRKASWRVSCGPQLPPGGAPAPTLTASLATTRSDVAPGDTVMITYTAASTVGLLETVVEISGAHDTLIRRGERFAPSVTRTVPFVVPQTALLGQPLRVTVHAVDAGMQVTSRELLPTPALIDNQPPLIFFASLGGASVGGAPRGLAATAPVGDTLYLYVSAMDNHLMSALVVELEGAGGGIMLRDSVAVTNLSAHSQRFVLPIRPEWAGTSARLRIFARDAHGNRSEQSSAPGAFRFFASRSRPTRTTALPGEWLGAVLDPSRPRVYVVMSGPERIVALSVPSLEPEFTIPLSSESGGLEVSPGGDSLLVLLPQENTLAVLDPNRPSAPPARIALNTDGHIARTFRMTANGRAVVVGAHSSTGVPFMLEVNLATGEQRVRTDAFKGAANTPPDLVASMDRNHLVTFAGCAQVYTVPTDRFGACKTMEGSGTVSVDGTGRRLAKGMWLYDSNLDPVLRWDETIHHLGFTSRVGLAPMGDFAYLSTVRGMLKARTTGEVVERFPVPATYGAILLSRNGEYMIAGGQSDAPRREASLTWVDLR